MFACLLYFCLFGSGFGNLPFLGFFFELTLGFWLDVCVRCGSFVI